MLCFGKFPVANRFMDKKGGFLSHNTETFRGGTPLCCFRKFLVAKKFMDKGEGEVLRFSFENFLSHGDENFRSGTLYDVTDFRYRKILCLRGL